MTVEMDTDGFYSALMRSVDNRQASRWQLLQQTGVSVTTLVRLGQGVRPDAASYAALCDWAGINPQTYLPRNKK